MNVEDFTFELPEELIAAHPAPQRDASRLLVVAPDPSEPNQHRRFRDLKDYLRPGDVLVMNNSRVIPARLFGARPTGALVEMLLLERDHELDGEAWKAMVRPGRKAREGETILIGDGALTATVARCHENGERTLVFTPGGEAFREVLRQHGRMPIPPYILKRRAEELHLPAPALHLPEDETRYQTVYAEQEGSIAAPTAGLHFTPELLAELEAMGVERHFVTLHVGAGTFVGMAEGGRVEDHQMHTEHYDVTASTSEAIARARREGRRVVAVGTTTVRTLESAWDEALGTVRPGPGETRIMIHPGVRVRAFDLLVTNFHLPRSTLLLLVSALIGRERLLDIYTEAIAEKYRFFSYGDAMLVPVIRS
ncbi:tRNA preQ1(34) S-adenosylmethionine ribosyltransferase-isomerase QueA [bacterium]|nr:tRNA preQ1(34) S-adenosylmethionine ribosyltransferase-isomerase QueA [bacterium]